MPSSGGSFWLRDQTCISCGSCTGRWIFFFTTEPPGQRYIHIQVTPQGFPGVRIPRRSRITMVPWGSVFYGPEVSFFSSPLLDFSNITNHNYFSNIQISPLLVIISPNQTHPITKQVFQATSSVSGLTAFRFMERLTTSEGQSEGSTRQSSGR